MARKKKPNLTIKKVGYRVSSSKHPDGRFFSKYADAYKQMNKEMMSGAQEAGISEVFESPEEYEDRIYKEGQREYPYKHFLKSSKKRKKLRSMS